MADPSNSSVPLSYRFVNPRGDIQLFLLLILFESFFFFYHLQFISTMDEIAPEYDVVVLGTGVFCYPAIPKSQH